MERSQGEERRLYQALEDLSPAYFGMVMATGIVSLAAHFMGRPVIAGALFALNLVAYPLLWALYALRLWRFPRRVVSDLTSHQNASGFFTLVAASCVLGSQCLLLMGWYRFALSLWGVALVLWLTLTYTIFTAFTIKERKPAFEKSISGGWLLAVVATQSIALLGALVAAYMPAPYRLEVNFLALSMWLWGGMLYIWMMSLIFYRYSFFHFSPGDLAPPYWINMGAMAISTLAGSQLILNAPDAPFLLSLRPFLKGFTVFYWATGTWWIPMLLILAVWRYVYQRFPLRYDPLYWGAVFPLGMYAASTHNMQQALAMPFLDTLATVFLYVALAAWTVTFYGLCKWLTSLLASGTGRGAGASR
ncbi:MAG: tellurite resistance/C4-dicarboxylate transporter family protein [Halomonas sp.]|nr:tellurite resistance/C4-dicarboxylate transporter family protein [Halomonas sp.]MDN6297648.1 tellurite resistance/C4-dicarboxylate transporter family protein [Halomonas sp.]MDN6314873.1 tellurite resistance/C4-dicarboxylate transporter family protein [Halomonas sp.]MDN6335790.1 tellurite resistance/C4-dicarboxylate transporter family protein [Halomonas sp.]